jgi:hypothetical protein
MVSSFMIARTWPTHLLSGSSASALPCPRAQAPARGDAEGLHDFASHLRRVRPRRLERSGGRRSSAGGRNRAQPFVGSPSEVDRRAPRPDRGLGLLSDDAADRARDPLETGDRCKPDRPRRGPGRKRSSSAGLTRKLRRTGFARQRKGCSGSWLSEARRTRAREAARRDDDRSLHRYRIGVEAGALSCGGTSSRAAVPSSRHPWRANASAQDVLGRGTT